MLYGIIQMGNQGSQDFPLFIQQMALIVDKDITVCYFIWLIHEKT